MTSGQLALIFHRQSTLANSASCYTQLVRSASSFIVFDLDSLRPAEGRRLCDERERITILFITLI